MAEKSFLERTMEESEFSIMTKFDGSQGDIKIRGAVVIPFFTDFKAESHWCPSVAIALPPDLAEQMIDMGYNVKASMSADYPQIDAYRNRGYNVKISQYAKPEDDPIIYTECNLNFESNYPPDVRIRTPLPDNPDAPDIQYGAQDIGQLSGMTLRRVSVRIHGAYSSKGQYTTKGYLNQFYATANENMNDDYRWAFGDR